MPAAGSILDSLDDIQDKAERLANELVSDVRTRTARPEFDAYIAQCYLDNLLRGGKPHIFAHRTEPLIHYIYGRRHGDVERDYNDFQLRPTYYSQGNGSYRDLCQNRRNDVFFTPEAGLFNIRTFMELIQIDGYNPLSINGCRYRLSEGDADQLADCFRAGCLPGTLKAVLSGGFDPGELLRLAESLNAELTVSPEDLLKRCMYCAEQEVESEFRAGYWSDHFTYNMDLIENYLAVFPDRLHRLLYEERFRFHRGTHRVRPRSKQYVITPNGVRCYGAVGCAEGDDGSKGEFLTDRKGHVVKVSLYVKLLGLALVKFCCLDPSGIGV